MSTEIDKLPFNTSTDLPVRDIPRETISHVADPQNIPSVQTYVEKLAPIFIDPNFGLVAKSISFGVFYYVFTLGVVYFVR